MYKVLIADDEKSIRDGLRCIIDWEKLGYEVCGEAANGEDALSFIIKESPDVVLLDIHMPKLAGLDVARCAREQGFAGRFVILSGYSDFKYAQTAIQYGVEYYLTKPLDEDELSESLAKIREQLDEAARENASVEGFKKRAKSSILFDLLHSGTVNGISQEDIQDLRLYADSYQVVLYENFNHLIRNLDYDFADLLKTTNEDNSTYDHLKVDNTDIILLKGNFAIHIFNDFLRHYENEPPQEGSPLDTLFIAYGSVVEKPEDIHLSYEEASTLISRRFFCMQGQHTLGVDELPKLLDRRENISDEKMRYFVKLITDHLQTFNRKKVAETLYKLEEYLYNVSDDIPSVKLFLEDLYLQVKVGISQLYSGLDDQLQSNSEIITFIDNCYYLYEIITYFSEQFEMIMSSTGNSNRDSILDDVIYYINHNYKNNIKLENIAPLFGYNSAYLGKIFNRTIGESFNSYVDHVRIEQSKKLLQENTRKVYEISEAIGYKNVDYFHKKFKKYVGMSPAEYRKSLNLPEGE